MTDVVMSDAIEEDFHLSGLFAASKTDIKDIVATSTNDIIIAGREEKIKFYTKREGEYIVYKEIVQNPGLQINSLAYYSEKDGWLIFAGRKNGSIAVYNQNFEEVAVFTHHSSNVCCLHIDTTYKKLLSGSWDNNVIIWPIEHLLSERFQALLLTGHTMSVWALATFKGRPGASLSASADKTIKLWQDDNCVRTYNGHTDVVRCLQTLSDDTFVSAANDSTYRVWHIESTEALYVVQSHFEDFIFSLTLMGSYLVSCGETGFIEIWKVEKTEAGECLKHFQALKTPAVTNWSVVPLSQDEFAVATNEGVVYLFSCDPEKKAPTDVLKTVEDLMSEKAVAELLRKEQQDNQEIVIKVALDDGNPQLELRYKKGSDPAIAAENFIRANNLPISYLNEITDYIVANIPEAKQAQNKKYQKQPTQKIKIDGELYDFAMDVTIDSKPLKMPFNVGEDPNIVAWRFCERNNVPVKYAPQFSELVKKELQGITKNTKSDFYDPFTGSGRYVPNSSNVASGGADPLTGSGRYIPSSSSNAFSAAGDPFTSGGRYIPGTPLSTLVPNASKPVDKLRPRCELVPSTEFYLFRVEGAANPKALAKLKETNEHQEGCKLNAEQLTAMENLLGGQTDSVNVGELERSALELGLLWPFHDIGIIIDLLRCALLHAELNKFFCEEKGQGPSTRNRIFEILVSNPPSTVKVFTCRAIANAFAHPDGQEMIVTYDTNFTQLVSQVILCFLTNSTVTAAKQLQVAAASALANWSLLLLRKSEKVAELGPREDVLRAIISKLETVDSFGDKDEVAMIRLLQAIVTLMWGDKQVIQTAKKRNIMSIVNRLKDAVINEAGKNIARCIVEMTFTILPLSRSAVRVFATFGRELLKSQHAFTMPRVAKKKEMGTMEQFISSKKKIKEEKPLFKSSAAGGATIKEENIKKEINEGEQAIIEPKLKRQRKNDVDSDISDEENKHKPRKSTSENNRVTKKPKVEDNEAKLKKGRARKAQEGESTNQKELRETVGKQVLDTVGSSKKMLGYHVSMAGGVEQAVYNAMSTGCRSFALFIRNQRTWNHKPMEEERVVRWNAAIKEFNYDISQIVPHGSYLLNPGSPDVEKLAKSREAMLDECTRCEKLGIKLYNFHPGSTTGDCTAEQCIKTIAETVNYVIEKTSFITLVIETMAGQGHTIGGKFQEIRSIIDQVNDKDRVGVCIDTCHIFAAGYDFRTKSTYEKMMKDFEDVIGFKYLKAFHLNDSKGDVGCKADRHENIGQGKIGKKGFELLMNDSRLDGIPLILETPEGRYPEEMMLLYGMDDRNKK